MEKQVYLLKGNVTPSQTSDNYQFVGTLVKAQIYLDVNLACLSVCLFVSNKRQNG